MGMNMEQIDFIGAPANKKATPTIRNQRPSVAEEKARLCLTLGELCRLPPSSITNGSINKTREWLAAQKTALSVVNNARSSVPQLTAAIANMRRFA